LIFPRKISLVVIPTYIWPLLILLVLFTTAAVSLFPPARLVSLYYGHPLKGLPWLSIPAMEGSIPGFILNQ